MIKSENKNIMEEKGRLRKLALSRRDELSPAQREKAGLSAAERLLSLPEIKAARTIMCYRSFHSEMPTDKLIAGLEEQGKILCFPVCEKGGVMWAYHPLDESSWKKGMMGIVEPDVEKSRLVLPEEIDVVICPIVAFDSEKRRMGYGGGYYDRYLPQCQKALSIGIAFETQRMESIPEDEHDRAMDIIATEDKLY